MKIKTAIVILLLPIIIAIAFISTVLILDAIRTENIKTVMELEYQQAVRMNEEAGIHPAVKQAMDLNLESVYQGDGIDCPAGGDARAVITAVFGVQFKAEGKGMYTATTMNGGKLIEYDNAKRNFATLMLDVQQEPKENAVKDISKLIQFVNTQVSYAEADALAAQFYDKAMEQEEQQEMEITTDQAGFVVTKHDGWLLFRIF